MWLSSSSPSSSLSLCCLSYWDISTDSVPSSTNASSAVARFLLRSNNCLPNFMRGKLLSIHHIIRLPDNLVVIFLYSSRSLGVKPFVRSSSSRTFAAATSLPNRTFQALKDSTVTGVPRVRAVSSYCGRSVAEGEIRVKQGSGAAVHTSKARRSFSFSSCLRFSTFAFARSESCSLKWETSVKVMAMPRFSSPYTCTSILRYCMSFADGAPKIKYAQPISSGLSEIRHRFPPNRPRVALLKDPGGPLGRIRDMLPSMLP